MVLAGAMIMLRPLIYQEQMTKPCLVLPHRWRFKHLSESNSGVPKSPGVYAIGHYDSFHGLELKRIYVYVGETKNLQRRLAEHLPDTEQNPSLRNYLRKNYATAACWYLPVNAKKLKAVQDELIRKIQPKFNTLGLSGWNQDS